jgi:cytochrome c biogenesis factor
VTLLGELALWMALLMATWTAIVSPLGGVTGRSELTASGARGTHATLALLVVAAAGLWAALLRHDFALQYVASVSSSDVPPIYAFAAFWAGQRGALLLSALLLAACSVIAVHDTRDPGRELRPFVLAVLAAVMVALLAALMLGANPFDRLAWIPPDGQGLDPRLRTPAMLIHPPVLRLGYMALAVPFALAVAALITRRPGQEWFSAIRSWALFAWLCLTVGMFTGIRWAYTDPAQSGYWQRDPIDNGALLPWLFASVFLVSVALPAQRETVRTRSVVLPMAAFLVALPGVVITRLGNVPSLEALARSPAGFGFALFIALALIASATIVLFRLRDAEVPLEARSARNRHRYGWYVAALGAATLAVSLAGTAFRRDFDVPLATGQVAELKDPYGRQWRFVSEGISRYDVRDRRITAQTLAVYHGEERAALLSAERWQQLDARGAASFPPLTRAGILSSPTQDVYVALHDVRTDDVAALRISFNPLVSWLWFGAVMLTLGVMLAMWQPARPPTPPGAQ